MSIMRCCSVPPCRRHRQARVVGLPIVVVHRGRVGLRAVPDALVGKPLLDVGALALELRVEPAVQRLLDAAPIGAEVVLRPVAARDVAGIAESALLSALVP